MVSHWHTDTTCGATYSYHDGHERQADSKSWGRPWRAAQGAEARSCMTTARMVVPPSTDHHHLRLSHPPRSDGGEVNETISKSTRKKSRTKQNQANQCNAKPMRASQPIAVAVRLLLITSLETQPAPQPQTQILKLHTRAFAFAFSG